MNAQQMRVELARLYPSDSFKQKLAKMSDQQVVAIYFRITNKK